jgi:hypothetical protein
VSYYDEILEDLAYGPADLRPCPSCGWLFSSSKDHPVCCLCEPLVVEAISVANTVLPSIRPGNGHLA